jgi:DNA-binding winged helix-turn-helix (wHTH) protein
MRHVPSYAIMRYAFGDCVFDRARRELTRRGEAVHTTPKLLGLLELLLDARPRALTKDEIHKTLWSGSFVSDATLTSLIAELRAALGDDARSPRLVRTVYGYGYAFCGDASGEARGSEEPAATPYRVIVGDREFALARGEHVLGRSGDAAILVDDAGVSRAHARITIDAHGASLQDLGSKNGTIMNGAAIDRAVALGDGSIIVLGTTALKFRISTGVGSTETVVFKRPDPAAE